MIKFRVLGPLEAENEGRPIRLGGRKQRTLLAYLALHANKVITNSQLVDALWGDDPPNTATQTIHVYVSQLRKALGNGDGPGAPLVTEGAGYMLRAGPEEIDLIGFQTAVKNAKAAAESGAVREAAALLRNAMEMWRGRALGDLAGEAALQNEATGLEEMRRGIMEELVDMELALGHDAEVVGELRRLVADDPLRERFRAQLMLALYRQGRQAQALEVYADTRRLLADELGIDPGRDLQTLHEKILQQDPSLDRPSHPSVAPKIRRPETEDVPSARAGRRTSLRILMALAIAGAIAIAATAISDPPRTLASLGPLDTDTLALLDPKTGELVAHIDLNAPITKVAFGYGSLWVTSEVGGTVLRIDPSRRSVSQTIEVGSGASGIAFGDNAVWVTVSSARILARIDPETNEVVQRLSTGNAPTDVAFAAGYLWTTNRLDGTVSQIDPASTRTVRTIVVGTSPVAIAGTNDGLWVADSLEGSVTRIDPETASVAATINVGNDPSAIAVAESIWVTNSLDGTVSKISPTSDRVVATVSVGGSPSGIAVERDTVWVTTDLGGSVVRLDADTAAVRDRIATENRPVSVAAAEDSLWTGILPVRDVHRGGTLRIVTSSTLGGSLDPGRLLDVDALTIVTLIHDGLVGLKRTGGPSSLELVPNLATSLPRPTNGGKTYTFEVRPNIRYSTGERVIPSDFRHSIERAFALRSQAADAFTSIRGAGRCDRTPEKCDLSESIVSDDERSTVTFHLRSPDPDFLYALTSPAASAIPSDTPTREMDFVPSTGAYKIDTYVPKERIVLTRNPHFRPWSTAAKPAGYVDEIEWRMKVGDDDAVELVKTGEADWIGGVQPKLPLAALRTRHASQLHIYPRPATYFMFLNTRVAPFDDLRVRRALNFAVDRAKVARLLGGSDQAAVTCQIQPPNQPNYEPYCPYSRGQTNQDPWRHPDVGKARRLIAQSGTRGIEIEVWALAPIFDSVGRYFVALLDDLGYEASLQTRRAFDRYFDTIGDPSRRIQIGAIGWFAESSSPSSWFDLFTCDAFDIDPARNVNHAGFCSTRVDRMIERAKRAQAIDPAGAAVLWHRVERALVDIAPMVPLANPNAVDFVSERLGNYRSSPAFGLLLDQVWVQ